MSAISDRHRKDDGLDVFRLFLDVTAQHEGASHADIRVQNANVSVFHTHPVRASMDVYSLGVPEDVCRDNDARILDGLPPWMCPHIRLCCCGKARVITACIEHTSVERVCPIVPLKHIRDMNHDPSPDFAAHHRFF